MVTGGAFAVVVLYYENAFARKLFKAIFDKERPWENELRKKVFSSEVEAYKKLMSSNIDLCGLAPDFRGVPKITKVLDFYGNDVSVSYLLDCCYDMELINGDFDKLLESGRPKNITPEALSVIQEPFNNLGIMYMEDSSVTIDSSGNIVKIIDFAVSDEYQNGENDYLGLISGY